jgi:hypothetical protein
MTDAEKIAKLTDALRRILATTAESDSIADQYVASVAASALAAAGDE